MIRRWRSILLFWIVLLVTDASVASFTDAMLDRLLPSREAQEYRLASSIYHHDLRPDVDTVARWGSITYRVRTNGLGFRSDATGPVELAHLGTRLLVIGDSFTEGLGVSYERTFAGRLASAYRTRGVQVLNAGVSSYSPTIYHRKVKHLVETVGLRFDTLAVFIDLSDISDEMRRYRPDGSGNIAPQPMETREAWLSRRRDWLVRHSLIFRLGRGLKKEIEARLADCEAPAAEGVNEPWYSEFGKAGQRQALAAMDRLDDLARRHGFGLIVVVYPHPQSIAAGRIDTPHVRFWRAWSERRDRPFLSLFPEFLASGPPDAVIDRDFMPCDVHWSAAGHARVADFFLAHYPDADALKGAARVTPPQ